MPQVAGDLGGQRQVGDDLLFGHVDDQARPFLELRAIGLHDIGNRDLDQRVDRDVDGGPQIDAELGEVEGSLERLCQRLLGQGDDVRFRCARQECAGQTPPCGWRARANASTPTSCFLRRSIFG